MIHHDQILQELQEKVARKRKLEAMIKELEAQHTRLSRQVEELDARRMKEQADVDKLEGRSLAAFFYNVIGKMDEQLDKEREEAYAAAVKFDAALRELEDVEAQLEACRKESRQLSGVEVDYVRAMNAKRDAVKANGGETAEKILGLESAIVEAQSRRKEVMEALGAGRNARSAAEGALKSMEKASGYATWDMLGGGMLADMMKYEALDSAQDEVGALQNALRRFHTELADVNVRADISVGIDGFTRTADYIFDGLFVDWAVSSQISRSQEEIRRVLYQLESALSRLESLRAAIDGDIRDDQHQIDQLVKETKL